MLGYPIGYRFCKKVDITFKMEKEKVWLLLTDLHGLFRGKLIPLDNKKISDLKTEFAGIFVNDILDRAVEGCRENRNIVNITAIPKSKRILSPWDENESYLICNAYEYLDKVKECNMCPRTLLKKAMVELFQFGLTVKCGMELEWTMNKIKDDNNNLIMKEQSNEKTSYSMTHYSDEDIQSFFKELYDKTHNFPTNIEALHVENGVDMFEAALSPGTPLETADSVQLHKMTIKRAAKKIKMKATFSPKPFFDQAGCGAHIHISLQKSNGKSAKNILFDEFLAGIMTYTISSLVLLIPTDSGFRRVSSNNFCTSNFLSFGNDTRHDSIRLVHFNGSENDARIEIRIPGGDVNPYLALYFCLQAGFAGIRKKLSLNNISKPGERFASFPKTLREATVLFIAKNS